MKYKVLDWIGMIPFCVLPWVYKELFNAPLTMTQEIIGVVLLAIQLGSIIVCLHMRSSEDLSEKEG